MKENAFDTSYLKNISNGNRDFEVKMLKTFLDQTNTEVSKISQYLQQKEWEPLGASVHKIKPSFHLVGALETEELLNTIEDMIRKGNDLDKLPELVSNFLIMCQKIIDETKFKFLSLEESFDILKNQISDS